MFNIIGLSGNAHKTTMRDAISCPVMAEIQNTGITKCCQGCETSSKVSDLLLGGMNTASLENNLAVYYEDKHTYSLHYYAAHLLHSWVVTQMS